ncbi:MAG: M20 aminoacylase family protein [Rhodospirillales bacterium]
MSIIERASELQKDMQTWRRDIHAHPETAFEEIRTGDVVAAKLEEFGIQVHRGLAKTGVVGTLKCGQGNRAIGLRADMDALNLQEKNTFDHASRHPGKMHACGHDGHVAMLLGAARILSETKNFDGTVHFIFQPAEENEAGGRVMVEEGLFDLFPVDSVYGMHNWPGLKPGQFAVKKGPMMASADNFEITITGKGAHAAMPNLGIDPVVVSAEIITALQTISSRIADPLEPVVVSVTQIHAGDTFNVIPDSVRMAGTCRAFSPELRNRLEPAMKQIIDGICAAHGVTAEFIYRRKYPPTVNWPEETDYAAAAAAAVVGEENVLSNLNPVMGAEDFAYMLEARPGSYVWLGQGADAGSFHGCMLHNPGYDFNDEVAPIGVSYWVTLVEQQLPVKKG